MPECGYKWSAPFKLAPGIARELIAADGLTVPVRGDTVYVEQRCVEEAGHKGKKHRSLGGVTRDA